MEALRWAEGPRWYRPDYRRCLTGVFPTVFSLLGRPVEDRPGLTEFLPARSPQKARRVLLMCLDALGFKELALSSRLKELYPQYGTWITSVFPSITSCALTSMYQALPPALHGNLGHIIYKDIPGAVMDLLKGRVMGASASLKEAGLDTNLLKSAQGILDTHGHVLPGFQVMDHLIVNSGLSEIIYGDVPRVGFVDPLEGVSKVSAMLSDMEQGWISMYLARVDTLSHVITGGIPQMGVLLRHLEDMLGWLAGSLDRKVLDETVLMVAADHGQNNIVQRLPLHGDDAAWLEAHTRGLGHSGRVLHVYLDPGREQTVYDWLTGFIGKAGRVFRFDEIRGLTGPEELFAPDGGGNGPRPDLGAVRRSLGDLVVVLNEGWNWDRTGTVPAAGSYESRLLSQHGALTWDEVFIPFIVAPLSSLLPDAG